MTPDHAAMLIEVLDKIDRHLVFVGLVLCIIGVFKVLGWILEQ